MAKRPIDPKNPEDRKTILRHPTRLAIARLCRREGKTISQLARETGMEDGAIRGTVKKMAKWKVLLPDPGSTAKRRVYRFSPAWEKDLNEALRRHRPLDLLEGQAALFVKQLHPGDNSLANVAWVVDFDGGTQSLLAMTEDASYVRTEAERLSARGVSAVPLKVGRRWNPALEPSDD